MNQLTERGGARIGRINATWPFAQLDVTNEQLQLNATIIGKYVFRPEDVTAIEVFESFGRKGIRIHHRIGKYSNKVFFWTTGNPAALIEKIRRTGFMEGIVPVTEEDKELIRNRKFMDSVPVRTSVIVAFVVLWNLLILTGDLWYPFKTHDTRLPFGYGAPIASGFVVVFCLLTLFLKPLQAVILKKGRTFDEIKPFFWFVGGICSLIFLAFTAAISAGINR